MAAEGQNSPSRSDFESLDPTHEDERGNTELARLRRNYSRASTVHAINVSGDDPTRAEKVISLPGKLTAACRRFWRHQISVTVDHHTCRDHLGMFYIEACPCSNIQPRLLSFKHFFCGDFETIRY
jgi:hypothetical protein